MQCGHEDVVVWGRDVGRVGNEAAGWNVLHAFEEAAVMNLQYIKHRQCLALRQLETA